MKNIMLLILLLSSTTFAQITEGKLYYTINVNFGRTAKQPTSIPNQSLQSGLIFEFNPKYKRYTTKFNTESSVIVTEKSSEKQFVASSSDSTKTIKYVPFKNQPKTVPPEEEKTELTYHDGFYMDLMDLPLTDTIFIKTNEIKSIMGYDCQKTILKIPDGTIINAWTTKALPEMEVYEKISNRLEGVILEEELISEFFQMDIQMTKIEYKSGIDNSMLIPFPEDYTLDLGVFYLDFGKIYDLSMNSTEPLEMIDCSDIQTSMKKMNDLFNQSKEIKAIGEKLEPEEFVEMTVELADNGKISSIHATRYGDSIDDQLSVTFKQLISKCQFQPVLVYQKPVSGKFTIYYHFPN